MPGTIIDLYFHVIQRLYEIERTQRLVHNRVSRATLRRHLVKIEFRFTKFGHFRQALPECLYAQHLCLHPTQTHRQGIQVVLRRVPRLNQFPFLFAQRQLPVIFLHSG